jgi:hypothetical protein
MRSVSLRESERGRSRCAHRPRRAVFLDTSRGGTRKWCDMNTCGNCEKKARFLANKRDSSRPRKLMNAARAAGSRGVENFGRALAWALTPPDPSPLLLPLRAHSAGRVGGPLAGGDPATGGRMRGARPQGTLGDHWRLSAGAAVPALAAHRRQPAGVPVLRPAGHPQRLPQLHATEPPGASLEALAAPAGPTPTCPSMPTGTWCSARTRASSPPPGPMPSC